MMNDKVHTAAQANYSNSISPWPEHDIWHGKTFHAEKNIVECWLSELTIGESIILNAGSGGTDYRARGTFVHLDIVEKYVCQHGSGRISFAKIKGDMVCRSLVE